MRSLDPSQPPPTRRVYLDHASATPLVPEALAAVRAVLEDPGIGNPGSPHAEGAAARALLEGARAEVRALFGAPNAGLVFTSGGTEAVNLGVTGAARARREATGGAARALVASRADHPAVLRAFEALAREGFEPRLVPVDGAGRIDPARFAEALDGGVALAATHLGNHEVGVLQPVAALAAAARARGVPLLCDATACAGLVPIDAPALGVSLLAVTAHRMGGPRGAGALAVLDATRLRPSQVGGTQEEGLRAGTENLAAIAGFAAAARAAGASLGRRAEKRGRLADLLRDGLDRLPGVRVASPRAGGIPGWICALVGGVEAEALVTLLDEAGFAVTSGSACTTGAGKPSHVLEAMGVPSGEARGALLLSLSERNDERDVSAFLAALPPIVARLRRLAP